MAITKEEIRRIEHFDQIDHPPYPDWYGMKKSLFESLGIPSFLPCNVHLQHGVAVVYNKKEPDSLTLSSPYPFLFYCNQKQKKFVNRFIGKPSFVVGSIFPRYRIKKGIVQNQNATGTLVFPAHSTHHVKANDDWTEYCEKLNNLPSHLHPITACIYWKDILYGVHKYFEQSGIEVVTCGHMFDPSFPNKFYSLLQKAKYTSSNIIGSYVYYSIDMDIPFFLFGNLDIEFINEGDTMNYPDKTKFKITEKIFPDHLKVFVPSQLDQIIITKEQKDFVNDMIGKNQQISDLKIKILIYLAVLYSPILYLKLFSIRILSRLKQTLK